MIVSQKKRDKIIHFEAHIRYRNNNIKYHNYYYNIMPIQW